jgi:hypothetical protein
MPEVNNHEKGFLIFQEVEFTELQGHRDQRTAFQGTGNGRSILPSAILRNAL